MKRILIIMSVGSHFNSSFGFAQKLVELGFDVTYAGTEYGLYKENLLSNVELQGFKYEVLDPYGFRTSAPNKKKHPTEQFMEFARTIYEGKVFENFVNKTRPDYILLDIHLPIYAIALYPYKIPLFFLSVELFTDLCNQMPPLNSSFIPNGIAEIPQWSTTKRELNPMIKALIDDLSEKLQFPLDRLIIQKTIVPFGLNYPEIILWPKSFEFPTINECNIKNKFYVGGLVDLQRYEKQYELEADFSNPLIYCSVGSFLEHKILGDFLIKIIQTASLLGQYDFIISAGHNFDSIKAATSTLPKNVRIVKFAPQIELLKKSNLIITLGGANTIKESIALGVPLLCFPFHNDQFGNSARVEHHSLGLRGDIINDSVECIKARILEVINSKPIKKKLVIFKQNFIIDKSKEVLESLNIIP